MSEGVGGGGSLVATPFMSGCKLIPFHNGSFYAVGCPLPMTPNAI